MFGFFFREEEMDISDVGIKWMAEKKIPFNNALKSRTKLADTRMLYNRQWLNITNLLIGIGALVLYLYYTPAVRKRT